MISSFPHRTPVAVLALLLGVLILETGSPQNLKKRRRPEIPLNERIIGTIPIETDAPAYERYQLQVSDAVFSLDFRIENSPADLDLFVYNSADDLIAYSELPLFNETLRLNRISDPALTSGPLSVEIAYQYNVPPRVSGETLTEIPFELTVHAAIPEVTAILRPGDTRTGRLQPDDGMISLYRIDVPPGTQALRLDISESDADVDLFLNRDTPAIDPFSAAYWAQSVRSSEVLVVEPSSDPPLRPGTYYATVIDQLSDTYPADYRISVHDRSDAPEHLLRPIRPTTATNPRDRPLQATVEVLTFSGGGSGVVVHPDGYILTNRHVVLADSGDPAEEITVGISENYARPPEARYLAEVVEISVERDLALLKIVSGRYGEPIPAGTEFVFLEPRFSPVPEIGDDLRFVGYPSIGGTGSRASITYTRGTVAGYQDVPFGRLIKTDAEINEGSSGGAAIDADRRLIGLPTEVVGLDAGQLAYIYPMAAIPRSWRAYCSGAAPEPDAWQETAAG
nr:serine protease [Spirochaeta sp.]